MFSIVIPLYNKETFIEKTLHSVLNQSFSQFEVIVVNDGSTDASAGIVQRMQDPRICMLSQENKGVSSARNKGIEAAQYDWIAFLDADDWWEPTFLATIAETIEKRPGVNVFATGRNHVYAVSTNRYVHPLLPDENQTTFMDYLEVIGRGGLPPVNSSNVVIKKEVLRSSGGFNDRMKAHEDHDLWLRLSINNEMVFINTPLSNYRKIDKEDRRLFSASEFLSYLDTLNSSKEHLNASRKGYLRNYCNRFIPWSFWKNRSAYSTVEKKGIIHHSKGLISLPNYWILWILYRF